MRAARNQRTIDFAAHALRAERAAAIAEHLAAPEDNWGTLEWGDQACGPVNLASKSICRSVSAIAHSLN
jgi:hypothetical protein